MQSYVIGLYIRLSLEDTKYDSLSIENQRLVLHEYAAAMPEAHRAEVLEFIDNGYSGTNFERPQVQKLIEMVRANQIDCIIVKDFSRFGRNSIETGYFLERVFPLFHTRFISVSDDYDSDRHKGDTGGMDVAFKYLINEYYSRDMSVKTKSAKYAKMRRGEYQSKICPYGYRKSADGRMEPDPEAAEVVRLIFQLSADGMNAAEIAREMFRRGIPTPGEYKAAHGNHTHDISRTHGVWCSSTILRMLEDERYTGTYVIGKRAVLEVGGHRVRMRDRDKWYIIPDHHPAIVDTATFGQSRAKQLRYPQPIKKPRDYPLKRKIFCGCCGHALSRTYNKTAYYYCRHSDADKSQPCFKMRCDAKKLEDAVFASLKAQMDLLGAEDVTAAGLAKAAVAQRPEYERMIDKLEGGKLHLYEQYQLGELDLTEYKEQIEALDSELLRTRNAYAALTVQAKKAQETTERESQRRSITKALSEANELTSALADLLIDQVRVYPDNRIEIAYKVQDLFE